jgi:hypothetical protein
MAASPPLIARLDELIALFNRKGMDLPEGLLDRRTQFLLNGAAFESLMGRSPDDPLVLMLARGPAGYRFAVKALQHAVPDARVERGEPEPPAAEEYAFLVPLWLSGHLRGSEQAIDAVMRVTVGLGDTGTIARANLDIDDASLARLREARQLD